MLNELNQADGQPFEFTPAQLVNFLNRSQDDIITLVPPQYFTSLFVLDESIALDSDGAFAISDLTRDVLMTPKNVVGVRVNSDHFAHLITQKEYIEHDRAGYIYDEENPVYYIRGNTFYVEPFSTGDTVDVYYVRKPVPMVMNTTGDTDDDTNCELPLELKNILLNLAVSLGYRVGKDRKRADQFLGIAQKFIDEIKSTMHTTDSTDYGTKWPVGVNPFKSSTVTTRSSFYNGSGM